MMSQAFTYRFGGEAREMKGDRSLPNWRVNLALAQGFSLSAVGGNVKFYYKTGHSP
jgi:hypothetical protein